MKMDMSLLSEVSTQVWAVHFPQLKMMIISYQFFMWFWEKNNLNAIADLDDGGKIGESLVERITKKVNGGLIGIADRKYYYRCFKKEFGV